jgi:hypothetical protein
MSLRVNHIMKFQPMMNHQQNDIDCLFINSWINHILISINNTFDVKCNDEISILYYD